MTASQWVGVAICALPFLAVGAVVTKAEGLRAALAIFLGVALVVALILAGSALATEAVTL